MFLVSVPEQNQLAFVKQYFECHTTLMGCFLMLERAESALLVIDLGRSKELHCFIDKRWNSVGKDLLDYARALWNRIEAREEQIEIESLQALLHLRKNDATILLSAFDLEGVLNAWVLNDKVIFTKLFDARRETVLPLIKELLRRIDAHVDQNSSFYTLDSDANTDSRVMFPFELRSRKPASKVENPANYSNFSDRKILEVLFKRLIDPVKDLVKGNKLIVVPDPLMCFAPFSALFDENGSCLSNSYSVQISPSLHTLKCTMEQSYDSNFGFALFVGNPTVGKVNLNGKYVTTGDLPGAAEEIKCLAKLFQAMPLLGRYATKQRVLQLLSGASIIHITAHGDPKHGEIMLAPNSSLPEPRSSVPRTESYLLTRQDILNTSVQARFIVLSCC